MKFSILIAHYNNALFFKDCFESILNQTYTNWEVIIVDDCSDESEKQAVKEMIAHDPRFFFYENTVNKGVGYTKKRCAELATGDLCGFVDPDDALTSNALEESIKAFSNNNTVATYSLFDVCNEQLVPEKLFSYTRKIKNGDPNFFNIRFEVAHFFTYRKKAYDQTEGIDDGLTSSVDQDLYLKLYEKGDFHFIKKSIYLYRTHAKGVSQDKKKKEKLYKNWHIVLYNTLKRRKTDSLYGTEIDKIDDLPNYIFNKQNTLLSRIIRKFS
ncbi:glycosyltransferase family 2 protein [Chryseobacterium pennipullorum]|uniref:Glycosyl transferase family 2 n=1 Tax=Chryseobacterium pennipullorum TaxID=2258963 RepID=A0A3D9B5R6_9FLAO|nr:glycosyltransferase [Chryseobacterium pennipullorum]REC48974.1 glycosyl transferase family 2 [Chryseobacterium pennipullorum]